MSTSDGYVAGTHKIVDHGDDGQRFNITLLGDGYRASELTQFATDVQTFTDTLRATAPFNEVWCAINVHRIDVVSTDSGADDPGSCGDRSSGSGATPRTYFDATFCSNGQIRRLLDCNHGTALSVAQGHVPHTNVTMVIVNSSEYGGSGGDVATFSTHPQSAEIGIHEMGHTTFGFADEYEYYTGCGSGESGHDNAPSDEPGEPNVTANTNPRTIKWKALLTNVADGLPTTANANCSDCDTQGNPEAASYVGAYEGARYYHCGLYRPQFDCRMRALNNPFCAVCQGVIRQALARYMPAESLILTTPSVDFGGVPEGLGGVGVTTYRAIVFDVVTCGTRTFRITRGPTGGFGTPLGTVVSVSANDADPIAEGRLWLSYASTAAGDSASGEVTVTCDETGQAWTINIIAHTIPRPRSAVALVLDHSGSMADDAGGGATKVAKLHEAANIFVNAMLPGDGLALVRFDDTAQTLMGVTDVGLPVIGAGRVAASGHINGSDLDPAGSTSIGAGVTNGKAALDAAQAAASPHYDVTAMIVLTDGMENTAPLLADVGSSITANTFAIGLGLPENISVAALEALTQSHSGYLLVTGAITPDQAARLDKYFLQVLAGVTNANVVLDPHGELTLGATHEIPFMLSETDYGADVFLLCPHPTWVDFQLRTPDGTLLDPAAMGAVANGEHVDADRLAYYRLALPALPADASGSHTGIWHAVLRPGRGSARRTASIAMAMTTTGASSGGGTLPYDIVVHTYSNLELRAYAQQPSHEPGATLHVTATLREYDVPVEHRASAWADVVRPDGMSFRLALPEGDPGRFEGAFTATLPGLYTLRVRAMGATFRGSGFQREQTLTAAVTPGGDRAPQVAGGRGHGAGDTTHFWCEALACLLSERVISRRLREDWRERGLDIDALARCLAGPCGNGGPHAPRLDADVVRRVVEALARELS